ncbi:MAG: threonylcarbamoyl-AMP synthase [Planctomycetes bacterium]|nr:threonylcarbamoyl-AMP synthase [Planctomycetota bacterium]
MEILQVDAARPDETAIARAAETLRRGGLVAFPTETVYGLGGNALDAAAVEKIFQAKGRPARNPIIVHIGEMNAIPDLAEHWPETAQKLAARFWPGPLTLVVQKNNRIPDVVTAGGPTVALRMPAHPVALALLRHCKLPVAAPSANRSSALSPTRADHVLRSLGDRFDLLLDAGPTPGGLESTVLDMTQTPPRLLRPGLAALADLEAVVGSIEITRQLDGPVEPRRSPGMLNRHYAPNTPLTCVDGDGWPRVCELAGKALRVGWLTFTERDTLPGNVIAVVLPDQADSCATELYAVMHRLDQLGLDCILVDLPPPRPEWLAVRDRLLRACAGADLSGL